MKLLIVEVEMSKYKTTYHINLNSESEIIWEDGCKEYEITEDLLWNLKHNEVIGWLNGVNRFGKPVKRTYMLVPE